MMHYDMGERRSKFVEELGIFGFANGVNDVNMQDYKNDLPNFYLIVPSWSKRESKAFTDPWNCPSRSIMYATL
jgi:hypothetical protein